MAGLELIISSFGTIEDKIVSIVSLVLVNTEIEVLRIFENNSDTNITQLGVGLLLLVLGFYLKRYIKNKIYILNINGVFDQRIENHRNDLKLSAFEFKEREIDFIWLYKKGMSKHIARDIIELIQEKIKSFRNESKEYKRGYTGISPIPFIMYAGTLLKKDEFHEYFEYDKMETHKYYRLKKIGRMKKNKYTVLGPKTNISDVNKYANEIVLAISITSEIKETDLEQFSGKEIVHLLVDKLGDNTIRYKEQLREYTRVIYDTIELLSKSIDKLTKIHLIYSGQSCLALELGKIIDDNRMTQIINYHYVRESSCRYPWGIVLNGKNKGEYVELECGGGSIV